MNAAAAPAHLEVATTILAELGGRRFMMMVGAVVSGTENSLTVRFKGSTVATHMVVTLDPSDTYTVEFFKCRGTKRVDVASHSMMYAEDLQALFTRTTGLFTSF